MARAVAALLSLGLAACAGPSTGPLDRIDLTLVSVAVSSSHRCGIAADGRAFCWGEGSSGELGSGTFDYADTPVPVGGGLLFSTLDVAFTRTCGVTTDGRAYCWGSNPRSELVRGLKALEDTRRGLPVAVADDRRFTSIGVGSDYACGITTDGTLFCWGVRGSGELGRGFTALDVGDAHACALDAWGRAWCWGLGLNGELGDGSFRRVDAPVPVAGGLVFSSISAGERFTCGATRSGEAYCWGQNHLGQLGVATSERCAGGSPCATRPAPVHVPAKVLSVSAGDARTCALSDGGAVFCWGGGPKAIVNRWVSDTSLPRLVSLGPTFRSLAVGGHRACGVAVTGDVFCWSTLLGLPRDPAGREGSRMVTRWFLGWALAGALVGVALGYLSGKIRGGPWSLAGAIWGAIGGAAIGFIAGFVVGFFKVLGDLW